MNTYKTPSARLATKQCRALTLLALAGFACDAPDLCEEDLPDGWECATKLDVEKTAVVCEGSIIQEPDLSVAAMGSGLELVAKGLLFREAQDVCSYQRDTDGDQIDVLLQPCVMHPDGVLKSDCIYEFHVALAEGAEDASTASISKRPDYWGQQGEPPVTALGDVPIP